MNGAGSTIDIPFMSWDGWKDERFAPNHFFQSYEWFSVLTAAWPELAISIRMIDERLALPVFSRRIGPLVLEGSPLRGYTTPYGGLLGEGDREFNEEFFTGDFNEIVFRPRCAGPDGDWKKMKTVIIDLRNGCDAIWKSMRPETRNKIRKAMKGNVTVNVCTGSEWVERAFEILTATYERQHVPPTITKKFFYQIAEKLMPEHARVYTAVCDGKIVAYAILCFDARMSYYLDGGLDRDYRHVCPSNIIQWEALQWSVAEHRDWYDMNGANIDSIATFKIGFGGDFVEYPTKEFTPTLIGTVAWRGYTFLRPAIKRWEAMRAKKSVSTGPSGREQPVLVGD